MRISNNLIIRLYIMTIALLGGLGFLGYLLFNISVANKHEHNISELHTVKFPVLQELLSLKQDIRDVHESISTALVLEHEFLLEETYATVENFSQRIQRINELDPSSTALTQGLQQQFNQYFQGAKSIADVLISQPEKSRFYEEQTLQVNLYRHELTFQLEHIIEQRKKHYVEALGNTSTQMKTANELGAMLGTILILALFALAWVISMSVLAAINRSDRLKEIFLATMSHELRTPINGISGAISLLKDTHPTPEQQQLLEACKASELNITTAIDDILEFTGMMSGKISIKPKEFGLQKTVTDIISMFKNDYQMKSLKVNIDDQLPPGLLNADEAKISHVLRHLIGNAIKFSEQGNVTVRLYSDEVDIQSSIEENTAITVNISVEDDGPGIDAAYIKDALKPFHQIDGSFNRQYQGMGIGLPMCNSIAKAMAGKITLNNKKEGGLLARFCFPTSLCVCTEQHTLETRPKAERKIQSNKILIVEDNKVNQMVLNGFLKKLGFDTDIASNGEEGFHLAQAHEYAAIMMDCQMPIMDGFEATEKIRQLHGHKNQVPIVAVTANAMEGDKEHCLEVGMDDYIKKPVKLDTLKQVISQYI